MRNLLFLLTKVYYVAKCNLCGWQWAVTSDDRALALAGCPACGSGENMVTISEEGEREE